MIHESVRVTRLEREPGRVARAVGHNEGSNEQSQNVEGAPYFTVYTATDLEPASRPVGQASDGRAIPNGEEDIPVRQRVTGRSMNAFAFR